MAGFNYITNEYVPRVDLNTLGQTFNTLEQGHKEAVKAASDLEIAVAALPMNEAEDGFKEQLINDIRTSIDENTIYGNSYAALDNLVMQKGNIASDGRVIGRLRNQAAKKEFDAKVDAMAITDGMKQMYKENNPYYYTDGEVDERTGRVKAGELWKPNSTPVATVPETEIQKYALQIAARDNGGFDSVYFLDANDRPTTDPLKSKDGSMYKKVGTKYERLSEDKIKQAYNVAIESIAGAKDSLQQDYEYAKWQRNKTVKNGENDAAYVKGLTDKNGNVYSYDQWLNNRINGFSEIAAYNHVFSNVSFGDALTNKHKRDATQSNGAGEYNNNNNDWLGAVDLGTREVTSNAYTSALKVKADANKSGTAIINKLGIKEFAGKDLEYIQNEIIKSGKAKNPNEATQYLVNTYGKNLNEEDKLSLVNSCYAFYKSNTDIESMLAKAGEDVDALKFSANVANKEFTNDNKYGKAIIESLNTTFEKYDKLDYEIGRDVFDQLKRVYGVKNLEDIGLNLTLNNSGNYIVTFDANNRNLLPEFDYYLGIADDNTNSNPWAWFKNDAFKEVGKGNYVLHVTDKKGKTTTNTVDALKSYGRRYKSAIDAASEIQDKIGSYKGTKNVLGTDVTTPGEAYYREYGEKMGYTPSEVRAKQKECKERVDRLIASGNLAGGEIYLIGNYKDVNSPKQFFKQTADATTLNLLLQYMYTAHPNEINRIYSAGDDQLGAGYQFTFTVPTNAGGVGEDYKGETISMYVTGSLDDGSGYRIDSNPKYMAQNFIGTAKATKGIVENIGYDNSFGDTRIKYTGNGKFVTNILGSKSEINEDAAELLVQQFIRLEQFKFQIPTIASNPNLSIEQKRELFHNNIDALSISIAQIIDENPSSIALAINNYLNNQ